MNPDPKPKPKPSQFFLAYKGALMVTDEQFVKGMMHCKKLGALTQVHAENGDAVAEGQKLMMDKGITGPEVNEYDFLYEYIRIDKTMLCDRTRGFDTTILHAVFGGFAARNNFKCGFKISYLAYVLSLIHI